MIYTDLIHIAASATVPMTSRIRSRIEYVLPTYNIVCFVFYTLKFNLKSYSFIGRH